jgi:hypothetical protein
LTGVLLHLHSQASSELNSLEKSPNKIFFCPEESRFYSYCLEHLIFNQCNRSARVIEFGSGDGSPIINSLCRTEFEGVIHGYELNPSAYEVAQTQVKQCKIEHKYVVHNESFFDADRPNADYLIANPPYIPAPDSNIHMPLLRGGVDGASITNCLLSLDYSTVMLLISSYSNPVNTITHAISKGYDVADFMVTPLRFGYYSSESSVKAHIADLRQSRKAFYSSNIYFLAGVLFKKHTACGVNLETELIQVMTALE